jgi:hypothetical protein
VEAFKDYKHTSLFKAKYNSSFQIHLWNKLVRLTL